MQGKELHLHTGMDMQAACRGLCGGCSYLICSDNVKSDKAMYIGIDRAYADLVVYDFK